MNYKLKQFKIIGLMSGTSMDGINGSYIISNGKSITRFNFNQIFDYSEKTKTLIAEFNTNPLKAISNYEKTNKLIKFITFDHANAVELLSSKYSVKADFIGFHGQTIYHNPENKISIQLGDAKLLSKLTHTNVVYDFRSEDIKNNGQGAPLAPIYHKYLIEELGLELPSCIINIGGVSNITYFDIKKLIGFDTGPGNALMDYFIQKKTNANYDNFGSIASKGNINTKILEKHLKHKFFRLHFPKSIDKFSFFEIIKTIDEEKLNIEDGLSTLSEFTARTIVLGLKKLPKSPKNIVITGGGMHNKNLIKRLKKLSNLKIYTTNNLLFDGNFIEAELIAFLSARVLNSLPNTFPSTTGVNKPLVGGKVILYKD